MTDLCKYHEIHDAIYTMRRASEALKTPLTAAQTNALAAELDKRVAAIYARLDAEHALHHALGDMPIFLAQQAV